MVWTPSGGMLSPVSHHPWDTGSLTNVRLTAAWPGATGSPFLLRAAGELHLFIIVPPCPSPSWQTDHPSSAPAVCGGGGSDQVEAGGEEGGRWDGKAIWLPFLSLLLPPPASRSPPPPDRDSK